MARLRVTKKRADADKEKWEEDEEKEKGVLQEAKRQGCQEGKDQFQEEHFLGHHNTLEPCEEKVDADAGEDGPAEDWEDPQDDQQDGQGRQHLHKGGWYSGVVEWNYLPNIFPLHLVHCSRHDSSSQLTIKTILTDFFLSYIVFVYG